MFAVLSVYFYYLRKILIDNSNGWLYSIYMSS